MAYRYHIGIYLQCHCRPNKAVGFELIAMIKLIAINKIIMVGSDRVRKSHGFDKSSSNYVAISKTVRRNTGAKENGIKITDISQTWLMSMKSPLEDFEQTRLLFYWRLCQTLI